MGDKFNYTCKICGGNIPKDTSDFTSVKIGNRYAHKKCYENKDKILGELSEIKDYCSSHIDDYNKTLVQNQLERYLGTYTPDEILKILKYFYGVKRSDTSKGNGGIGIVPYVADEALSYYENKEKMKMLESQKQDYSPGHFAAEGRRPQPPKAKMIRPRNRRWVDLD